MLVELHELAEGLGGNNASGLTAALPAQDSRVVVQRSASCARPMATALGGGVSCHAIQLEPVDRGMQETG